jgi:hypothetical protein
MNFLSRLEKILGRKSRRPTTDAVIPEPGNLVEVRDMAAMSRRSTRDPIELAPPGPRLTHLTTDDLDKTTGQLYPDFLERRRQRAEGQRNPEPVLAGTLKHDCHPDN